MDTQLLDFLARWWHIAFGVTWIGLLYYFNFVQTEYFKEADPDARTDAFTKLAPRALWWFRWGAMFTFLTGLVMLGIRGGNASFAITLGSVMGILMFLNVWLIIWPNQKIIIESNKQVKAGGEALAEAGPAAPKAGLASRTNTLFSIPMLFFMVASSHLASVSGLGFGVIGSASTVGLAASLVIIAALQLNAIFGKPGPIASVRGVIVGSIVLTGVLWGVVAFL
jgi:uncharacterized membrane protein